MWRDREEELVVVDDEDDEVVGFLPVISRAAICRVTAPIEVMMKNNR